MSAVGKTDERLSSSDTVTPSTRSDGVSWSQRMRDAGFYPVKRDFNRFMHGDWVKLEEVGPLGMGPLEPDIAMRSVHSPSCLCGICLTEAQHQLDWCKARSLDGI